MLQRCAAASVQPPELCAVSQCAATAAAQAPAPARQLWRTRGGRAVERVELPALHAFALARAPLHLAVAGFACTLLLNAHSATAAAEPRDLVGQSAVRDETERVLAEELAQSFRRLPEDEQVALVERLLRRAIASDASSRGVRTELQAAPPPRKRSDAEPSAEPAVSRGAQQAQAAPANGLLAAAPSVEPTSVLDAQDGWDGAAPSDAPPLALELEKLLPSAPSRTLPATSRSPAAATTSGTPAGVMVASQPVSDTFFSRGLTPLAAAVAAGAAAVLGVIAVWLKPGRAADATPQQTAPADDRPQAPPGLSARVATPGEVEAATTRRPEVLWSRKETPQADASAADADGAAPGVLWKRGAPRTKPVATEDAPTAAGDVKESVGAAELSDNAEGLRFGARLKQPPK